MKNVAISFLHFTKNIEIFSSKFSSSKVAIFSSNLIEILFTPLSSEFASLSIFLSSDSATDSILLSKVAVVFCLFCYLCFESCVIPWFIKLIWFL